MVQRLHFETNEASLKPEKDPVSLTGYLNIKEG